MKEAKLPPPARKIFISQLQKLRQSSPSETANFDPNLSGKYAIELEKGSVYFFTNVWIQGNITDIRKDSNGKTVMRLNDGTGAADVFGYEAIVQKNFFLEKSFCKDKSVMVTGIIIQPVSEIPCIHAARISEMKAYSKEGWESEVKQLQHYICLKTKK